MISIKHASDIIWFDLPFIERPDIARITISNLANTTIGGTIVGIEKYQHQAAAPLSIPKLQKLFDDLDTGLVYLVNPNTLTPAIDKLRIIGNSEVDFELSNHIPQISLFKTNLEHLISHTPQPQVFTPNRNAVAEQTEEKEKKEKKKENLLTIKKIARKLRQIEGASRLEEAKFFARKIGWEGICGLVEVGHPENDPNLMPSRFMILPGASDAELKKRGNLNSFKHPVIKGTPDELSVYNLKQFLIMGGYLSGETPFWQTPDALSQDELDKLKDDGGIATTSVSPLNGQAEFDSGVEGAFNQYLGDQSLSDPSGGNSHTVKEGETLTSIAEKYGFPSWETIWQPNRYIISNPDLIFPGQELALPDLVNDELEPWFNEFDNGSEVWQGSNHYKFPGNYFSLSVVDRSKNKINGIEAKFDAYNTSTKHLFYCLELSSYKSLSVMLPDSDQVGIGFANEAFGSEDLNLVSHKLFLYGDDEASNELQFDEDDGDLVPSDFPLQEA